ncbi:hypothetical protein [Kordia jejudonensis]|uniref:hypothetical protein n=1 Tax=Kordia jejudonensis TaxID=1348245 RepID=UPI00062904A8|nr:hypothetical protein [Kordia jejudonensis]
MKKRSVKSLKLGKSSVSKLGNQQIKGGTLQTTSVIITKTGCTSFIDACPTAWCPPTVDPKTCPFPY